MAREWTLKRIGRVWKYALGSFHDEKTQEYDNIIAVIRTFILLSYLVTNCVIVAGVIRHWNPKPIILPEHYHGKHVQ